MSHNLGTHNLKVQQARVKYPKGFHNLEDPQPRGPHNLEDPVTERICLSFNFDFLKLLVQ